jgi:hypothetical protein
VAKLVIVNRQQGASSGRLATTQDNLLQDKKSRSAVEREKRILRNDEPDSFADENVGRFWDNEATIPYMIARYNLAHAFLRSRSFDAVQVASDNCREMLPLNRADHNESNSRRMW